MEVLDFDPEDEEAWNNILMDELIKHRTPFKISDFNEVLDKELGTFKKDEKYDFVKDLKSAYQASLSTPLEAKIFKTIPSHKFWDIKKPLQDNTIYKRDNRYNPFRGREYSNFFEMRDAELYLDNQYKKNNLNNSISMHNQYWGGGEKLYLEGFRGMLLVRLWKILDLLDNISKDLTNISSI